jgi:hypothetical protein
MEADRAGILRLRGWAPFAGREHGGLVVLVDPGATRNAFIMCRFGLCLVPVQPLEVEPLHLSAMRTRDEIPALVRGLVFALDAREPMNGRRRAEQDLRAP